MARRALIFSEPDALAGALEARLVASKALGKPVDYLHLDDGGLAIAPGRSLSAKVIKGLERVGVETRSIDGSWLTASCWPALIPCSRQIDEARPSACMFMLTDEKQTLELLAELLRLGCHQASFCAVKPSKGDHSVRALVRAYDPPYYSVIRGVGPGSPFVPFVPASRKSDRVWIEFGFDHRFATSLKAPEGQLLLARGLGPWHRVEVTEWSDVLDLAAIEISGGLKQVVGKPISKTFEVPLTLRDASRDQSPTLWVLDGRDGASAVEQVEGLISSLPDDVASRFLFAAGTRNGQKDDADVIILRARSGRGAPPQIDVNAAAYVGHRSVPNLYLPVGTAIEPPLRTDTLREKLAPDPAQVVWLSSVDRSAQPDASQRSGRGFGIESIEETSFAPLADWVDYTLAKADKALNRWVEGVSFQGDAFVSIGTEWSSAQGRTAKEKKKTSRREPKPEPEVDSDAPSQTRRRRAARPSASLAALPTVETGNRAIEELLDEIEREFLDDDAPADSPTRAMRWQKMARLHAELENPRDGSHCLLRWLWEAPEEERANLSAAWLAILNIETSLGEIVSEHQGKRAHPVTTLAAIAQLNLAIGCGEDIDVDIADLTEFLDRNDEDLDVRSMWLGREALSRSVGGDRLALARTRDRLLRKLRAGLSLERDVPTFLRFLGAGGGHSSVVAELVRNLEAVVEFVHSTDRKQSPTEPPVALTMAYVDLELAYGFARLGQLDRAKAIRDQGRAALSSGELATDPVHSFLVRAYCERVEQAIKGAPVGAPLPPGLAAELNQLSRIERYKVDRLRQASSVLEPQERLDPILAYSQQKVDPLGEEFAPLRGLEDIDKLRAQVRRILELAMDENTSLDDRARLFDGVMDFFPLLPESDASAGLDVITAGATAVEPKKRALLYEEALMLAGFFGRQDSSREIATSFEGLLTELSPQDVAELAAEFGACLRSLRRVGLSERASAMLEKLAGVIVGESIDATLARLHVAGARAYLGNFDEVGDVLETASKLIRSGKLSDVDRMRLIGGLARAWTFAPAESAMVGLRALTGEFRTIKDIYNTNTHFCLSVVTFVDSLVLGFASGDLALGDVGRRWLDEDEYLVRRRIHRELERF